VIERVQDVETPVNSKIQMLHLFRILSDSSCPTISVLISRESKTFSALVDGQHELLTQHFV